MAVNEAVTAAEPVRKIPVNPDVTITPGKDIFAKGDSYVQSSSYD